MSLPVDPERLRRQFPELSEADLEAYVAVTQRILAKATPGERTRLTRAILGTARDARSRADAGATLSSEESLAVRYLEAVGKMQRSTVE
jgi:hypothetical protein